ncbi:aldo/keto reductase [Aliidongia dinghuensis]|uniref:Protein tas n=1 Tax=Aliidongia dinghuensis TaxID=1867774 RepID=A0A8J2YW63_9PROT|nr:NADP(H)-dependent aldo-keto reductase [Aliidongia dinghuensis]GGF30610.1 aldo/keto reductase [Aliidongia dinghuensis]
MEYRRLGRTDIEVSRICLGTMTFGEQNTEAEAHAQLSLAVERGINFLDAAEMYPVPPKPETQGLTERYIGSWLKATGLRDRIVIATKVVGSSRDMSHFRDGKPRLDRANIRAAVEGSLARLGTDRIDLYQLHWPDRKTTTFGQTTYRHEIDPEEVPIEATLEALAELVREGKIRAVGLSNETPWGTMRFLALAERYGLPRVASIQNAYSLVNRTFEQGLAEVALREDCGLLAYSPLGGGTLSGKYLNGARPEGARMTLFKRFTRYDRPEAVDATGRYVALAREHGLDPAQMALAFAHRQPFVTSTIIGATTLDQLESDLAAFALPLDETVLAGIEAIHRAIPNPAP